MSAISITLLNHASYIWRSGDTTFLFDPWYEGTCFRGGWGLRYDNPEAFDQARDCTHLWISHFHGDHLHLPTLRRIAAQSPNMQVLANVSANFDMRPALEKAGFKKIQALFERRTVSMAPGITLTRYPATGIDNMLVLRAGGLTTLNLNDCNLPRQALINLVKKIGPIDVLLLNFNHAYKLLDPIAPDVMKEALKKRFLTILDAVRPKNVIPFASMHYYRAPASQNQNASMLSSVDLANLDKRVLPLGFGDEAIFNPGQETVIRKKIPALVERSFDEKIHTEPASWEELMAAANQFCTLLKKNFFGITFWLPPLKIRVTDHQRTIRFDATKGIRESTDNSHHIAAHSQALMEWFAKPFGTDAFFVGADFEIIGKDTNPLKKLILAGDLIDNGLSLKHLALMVLTLKGLPFLWNRREEITALLINRQFAVGNRT